MLRNIQILAFMEWKSTWGRPVACLNTVLPSKIPKEDGEKQIVSLLNILGKD